MSIVGGMEMWGIMPYEGVRCVEVTFVNWIEGVGDGVQPGCQFCLSIRVDVNRVSFRKPAEVNERVDEHRFGLWVPFPLDHRVIVPDLGRGNCCRPRR